VARIGGDEFAVCALVADQDAAAALGLRLQQAVSEPLVLVVGDERRTVRLHPSIGGVWTEAAPIRRKALMRAADATLDDVKRRGGGLVLTEARLGASLRHPGERRR
jgi:GGDEF domain-containing protein